MDQVLAPVVHEPVARTRRARLSPAEHQRLRRRRRVWRELNGWAFLAPQFVFFVMFLLVPVLAVFWWSTQQGGVLTKAEFVGVENYLRLPRQVSAVAAIRNTFVFALLSIPATLVIALGIAMLLARVRPGRLDLSLPGLLPGARARCRRGLIWVFLTNVDFGLFDTLLRTAGMQPVTWLGPGTALGVLAALDVWRSVGYWAIFFLAAIIGLPQELYQAAELDGASTWQRFRRLTLPLLRRIILFAIVVSTIFGLQIFDTALILTNGGPGTATNTIVYLIWRYVFGDPDKVGFAAAMSVGLLVAILGLTLVQLRALRGRGGDV